MIPEPGFGSKGSEKTAKRRIADAGTIRRCFSVNKRIPERRTEPSPLALHGAVALYPAPRTPYPGADLRRVAAVAVRGIFTLRQDTSNMRAIAIPLILIATATLAGCGSTTGARVGTGTAMGLATGAVIGSFSAQAGAGALIGAGVGALGGFLVDEHQKGNL